VNKFIALYNPVQSDVVLTTNYGSPMDTIISMATSFPAYYKLNPSNKSALQAYATNLAYKGLGGLFYASTGAGTVYQYLIDTQDFGGTPLTIAWFVPLTNLMSLTGGSFLLTAYDFSDNQVPKIYGYQNITQSACLDTKFYATTAYVNYGGFPHLSNSCLQDLAHTGNYINSFTNMYWSMRSFCASTTSSLYSILCAEHMNRLAAALAWYNGLTTSTGGILMAPQASIVGNDQITDVTPTANWTNFSLRIIWDLIDTTQNSFGSGSIKVSFDNTQKTYSTIRQDAYRSVDFALSEWDRINGNYTLGFPVFWGNLIKAELHRQFSF
jgi:hypothetical protein